MTDVGLPENGSATVARALSDHKSLPARLFVGMKGHPIAPAINRSVIVRLVQSGSLSPDSSIAIWSWRDGAGAG